MSRNPPAEKSLVHKLDRMKSAFSNYNMVRMREALRYLSGPKLELIHKHSPFISMSIKRISRDLFGEEPEAQGIYNFEESGFCKEILNQGETP